MWYSQVPSKTSGWTVEEHSREDDRRQRDDSGLTAGGDDDSGFLSAGNMHFCSGGDVRDPGLRLRETTTTGGLKDVKQRRGRVASTTMPEVGTIASTTMTTMMGAKGSVEGTSIVDSGVVDVELCYDLDRLTLRSGSNQQTEPRSPELLHVDGIGRRDEKLQQGDIDTESLTISKEILQLYSKDGDGDTQLHIAIMQGYAEAAAVLISLAPHPRLLNITNDHLQSPLHLAVLTQQPLIVRRLVLAGAELSSRNFRGNTALHLACANGDLACAKALTDPLYPMERNKLTPGQKVPALPQNLEQINYNEVALIGANLVWTRVSETSPAKSPTTMIHRVFLVLSISLAMCRGEMCLHVAVANGHVNLARLLLRLGADLEARECLAGRTALHLAVERKCQPIIAFLLKECEPRLDTRTYSGLTAYQLALYTDRQIARELLRRGARPEPLPDSDSESSDDEPNYASTILHLKNVQRLKV